MLNLEDRNEMIRYLLEKEIINEKDGYTVEYCKGGVSCVSALIEIPGRTLLVKQGRPRLAVKEEWLADPARMAIETKANEVYNRFVPQSVPAVLSYDDENFILVREAAPADCTMWKEDLLAGILDFEVAKKTMEALAIVHTRCHDNPEMREMFADDKIFYQLRISPYIEFVVGKYPQLAERGDRLKKRLLEEKATLVHADYSPKNILVLKDRSICILDYEISHYGVPAFDVAFFTNHIVLKSAHKRQWSGAFLNMLLYMTDTYFSMIDYDDPKKIEKDCLEILAMMMIARIDGKSPAEYITSETTKQLVRDMAFKLLDSGFTTYREAADLFLKMESAVPPEDN